MTDRSESSQKKTILVVDDDTVTTDLAKMFLEKNGFAVLVAHDGEAALRIAEAEHPDLILLDVMIPKVDGFEVCRILKSKDEFRGTPILMFTAKGLTRDIQRGQEVGADEYIVKPFSGRALVATMKRHLGIEDT